VAVSMSYGLITLYREKLNRSNKFANALSADSFSVYMFHAPLIIGVSILLSKLNIVPIAKFIIAAAVSLPLIFALSHFILRRIPLLKKIL
jgi:peptidoglycan/LPS O-acetylase OafA/YrhL